MFGQVQQTKQTLFILNYSAWLIKNENSLRDSIQLLLVDEGTMTTSAWNRLTQQPPEGAKWFNL